MTAQERQEHEAFIANEILTFSVVTEGMSLEKKKIAAEGNAEHILLWITSRPVRFAWLRRLLGVN